MILTAMLYLGVRLATVRDSQRMHGLVTLTNGQGI